MWGANNWEVVPIPNLNTSFYSFQVGDSKPNGQEDISPYATFHLLGMREEAKAAQAAAGGGAANFQTMPHGPPPPSQGPPPTQGPLPTQQQINNSSMAPTTPRHMSQTMNVSHFEYYLYPLSNLGCTAFQRIFNLNLMLPDLLHHFSVQYFPGGSCDYL